MHTGSFVRDIGSREDYTYYINKWFHEDKFYIINANSNNVRIYNMDKPDSLYKTFHEGKATWHMSAFVEKINGCEMLVETDGSGHIRVWDIEQGKLTNDIVCSPSNLRGICMWNEQFLIACSSDKTIKVVDIKKNMVINSMNAHTNSVCSAIKVKHPKYGECLITGSIDGSVKLFVNKNFIPQENDLF